MGHEVRRGKACLAVLAAGCAWSCAAAQEPTSQTPFADFVASSDTEGFHALRKRAGLFDPYSNPWSYTGVAVQSTRYSQGAFHREVSGAVLQYRDQRRDTLAGLDLEAGAVSVSGHLRPVGDVTLRMTPTLGTSVDLIAAADLVETRKALDRGIGYTFVAAAVERQFGERFTTIGLAGWQSFSDGNSRVHLRARAIWLVVPEHGVSLQGRYRQYSSRDSDVGGAYFNPDTYRQWLAVAAIRKRHAGWVFSAAVGAGQEDTGDGGPHASYLAEARGEGPIGGEARLVLRAGYYRSAGFVGDPDYGYRMVGANVVVPLR